MKKLLLWLGLPLAVFILIGAVSWFYVDPLLNRVARPQIAALAATLLNGDVQIGQLQRTESGLEALNLHIAIGRTTTDIPRVTVDFNLASLWRRHIDKVLISHPAIRVTAAAEQPSVEDSPPSLPARLPFSVAQLAIIDGRLEISTLSSSFSFHQLDLTGSLQPHSSFTLSGYAGDATAANSFKIVGSVQFSPQQDLVLEELRWQERSLLAEPLTVTLDRAGVNLSHARLHFAHFDDHQLQSLLRAFGQSSSLPAGLGFILDNAAIDLHLSNGSVGLGLQSSGGHVTWQRSDFPFSGLEVTLEQSSHGWDFSGRFSGPVQTNVAISGQFDNSHRLTGQAEIGIPNPGGLTQAFVAGDGLGLTVNGTLQVSVAFSLDSEQLELKTQMQGQTSNRQSPDALFDISGLSGQGKLSWQGNHAHFTLNLLQRSQPLASLAGSFQDMDISFQVGTLAILKQLLPNHVPPQLQDADSLTMTCHLTQKESGWIGQLGVNIDKTVLAGITLSKFIGRSQLQITAEQVNFREFSATSEVAYGSALSGKVAVTAATEMSRSGYVLQLTRLSVSDLNYNSADGLSGVGNAALSLAGKVGGNWPLQTIDLDLNGTLSVHEVLAGVFYADLSQQQATFSLRGQADMIGMELTAKALQIELPKVARLSAQGRLGKQQLKTKINIEFADMTTSYGKIIKPLLEGAWPQLTALDLAGAATLDAQLQRQATGWRVDGALRLKAVNARWNNDRIVIAGGQGPLPFIIGRGTLPDSKDVPRQQGTISFQSLVFGPARLQQASVDIIAERNRIALPSALRLHLADGTLSIEDVILDWNNDLPQGELNINVAGVNLESLTRELGLPIMQGSLSADLGKIRYRNRELSTAGVAGINVFDGRFQIGNMRLSQPFSSHPTFFTDIDFSGLDLQQATRTFDFGEMNGILDGYIHGLQLYGLTPAAFVASVSTRTAGTRNISVKALNNISILSQGGISAALSRGIYRFIDFYRYRKIAFDCSLVNDTFTLIGTALPDSKRYLVYGALLPPRIDITISTPTISFKEMLKRLSRIDRTSGNTGTDTTIPGTGG